MKELSYQISVIRELTVDDVKAILTTAVEGGIGYWAILDNSTPEFKETRRRLVGESKDQVYYCDVLYDMLQNNIPIIFENVEDENEKWELDISKLMQGCKLYEEYTGKNVHHIIRYVDFDAEDVDQIMQYALFGRIIYG